MAAVRNAAAECAPLRRGIPLRTFDVVGVAHATDADAGAGGGGAGGACVRRLAAPPDELACDRAAWVAHAQQLLAAVRRVARSPRAPLAHRNC